MAFRYRNRSENYVCEGERKKEKSRKEKRKREKERERKRANKRKKLERERERETERERESIPAVLSPQVTDTGGSRTAGLRGEVAAQVVWGADLPSSHQWVKEL